MANNVFIGGIGGYEDIYSFRELDKINLNSLKKVAETTSKDKLLTVLKELNSAYKKYSKLKGTTKRDNAFNKAQRYIIIQELRKRK